MFELFIEQLPESVFFALFMILAKNLKTKRILYLILNCIEYVLLLKAFPYSIYSHVGFFVITYIILKMLYKEKSQITDMFLLAIASLFLMFTSFLPAFLMFYKICDYITYVIINRIVIFLFLYIFRNKIKNIQNFYKILWNRNDKISKKIKSTTFRSMNIVVFNFMFFIINFGLAFAIYYNNK